MLQRSRPRRAYRRTRVTAALSGAALGAAVLLAPQGVAQESEPETGEIRNGTAKAIATVSAIAPGVGNLALGMTAGTAVTQVTNSLAQSTSQTANLGLVGDSLTAESCTGGDATFTREDLPQPVSVDNRGGDATRRAAEGGSEGSPGAFGEMSVAATEDPPSSSAQTTMAALGDGSSVRLGGGEARALTRVIPGEGREAVAEVSTSLSLGGVLDLHGLRWTAHHRTGVDPFAAGTFELGGASVGGLPLPIDDLEALEDAMNTVLGELGIRVSLPRVERFVEPADFVRVTPLVIELRDTPVGKAVLGPVLDVTRAQRNQMYDDLVEVFCQAAGVLLVGDVAVSVVGGTGFLTIGLGGVEAQSSDLELGNPFGDFTPGLGATPPDAGGEVPAPAGGEGTTLAAPSVGAAPGAPAAPGPTVGAPGAARPAGSLGPIEELCESIHPNGTSCSEGAAGLVGALGLLATAGIAGVDTVRQRRRADLLEA